MKSKYINWFAVKRLYINSYDMEAELLDHTAVHWVNDFLNNSR